MKNLTIRAFQNSFLQSILDRETDANLLNDVVPVGKLTRGEALEVYRRDYICRLTEALGETFEAVWWVLGDHLFFAHCAEFIGEMPSASYNLSDYGKTFPSYLSKCADLKDLPFLGELARFEWTYKELFHMKEDDHLSAESLAPLQEQANFEFIFGKSCFLLHHEFSVYKIWQKRKEPPEKQPPLEWQIPEDLVFYKQDASIYVKSLEKPELETLQLLKEGKSLEETFSTLSTTDKDFDEHSVNALFQFIFQSGIVKEIKKINHKKQERLS